MASAASLALRGAQDHKHVPNRRVKHDLAVRNLLLVKCIVVLRLRRLYTVMLRVIRLDDDLARLIPRAALPAACVRSWNVRSAAR